MFHNFQLEFTYYTPPITKTNCQLLRSLKNKIIAILFPNDNDFYIVYSINSDGDYLEISCLID
jgi:hypothetical protein